VSPPLRIRQSALLPREADLLAAVAARVFLHDPLAVAVFGGSGESRERRLRRVYGGMLRAFPIPPLTAWRGTAGAGLLGLSPGRARPRPAAAARALPHLLRGARPRELAPARAWLRGVGGSGERGVWRLGPLAVDPEAQGEGVGSELMSAACERLDAEAADALVSTDVEANLGFYARFGFESTGTDLVVGQTVWHLRRTAGGRRPGAGRR
jgi:ribosomal protein S18 acetylase RimI-like enzyme